MLDIECTVDLKMLAQLLIASGMNSATRPAKGHVIVRAVGPVNRAQKFLVQPVDRPAVAREHFGDFLLVQQHTQRGLGDVDA
jgi:hypothetical protein